MRIGVRGRLRVYRTDLNRLFIGEPVVDTHNLVMDDGLSALAVLLGGGFGNPTLVGNALPIVGGNASAALSGASLSTMLVGTRSPAPTPVPGDGASGEIPSANVPAVGRFTVVGSTLAVSYPDAFTVTFTGTIAAGAYDAPAAAITEEMLLTGMGTVFSRVALPTPVNTLPAQGLSFVHDVIFSRV